MKKAIFISIAVILIVIIVRIYFSSELHFPFNPYIDTIFTKNFTIEKFDKITPKMSQDDVKNILGEPLHRDSNEDSKTDCWQYSTDGKLYPYADFSYYLFQVCFNKNKVESKNVNEFLN